MSTNGTAKSAKVTPTSTVPSSPAPSKTDLSGTAVPASGKPDKAAYDAEQARIRGEIDGLQTKLAAVREKISSATKSDSGSDKRATLKAELESIRGQQSSNKLSRGKTLDQLKALQDGIQKKIKDLQAARSKTPFKTAAEVDVHIKNLEKQIESGSMKIVDEKRALHEIDQARRSRRVVEKFQADQESIEADRQAADELRKLLDDPESKEISERYDSIKAELDELKKEADEVYAGRSKLFEERDGLQAQISALFNEKRDSANRFREASDRYWTKLNEERARRAERARTQRAAEEAQKKLAIAERLREEASLPAFQMQIEDCQTLVDALSGKSTGNVTLSSSLLPAKQDVSGVPQLEIRQVEAVEDTMVARKKKDEESYFVGKAKKGKKGPKTTTASPTNTDTINLPYGQLSALLSLSIPPPTGQSDVPRVIEDLKTKKAWYEANQARQTAENIAKAEAEIQRLTNGTKANGKRDTAPRGVSPPDGGSEHPSESVPTDAISQVDASEGQVDEKLEDDAEEI
ncbi:nuclear segregation protein Bfr1 [Rhizopogon vinicolor AM-OR11-026]|uniref:Nuclear segregation protein Bfr1 n=1 Tax=Rhizopogon vinicolor AM-OR11-026 TaxID=1314800 RepID=A0A1B7NFE2_9AGAM|nr:nuclear segregation protein Bfr1 [Rhizopogon vinicolor AM-OR11-026]